MGDSRDCSRPHPKADLGSLWSRAERDALPALPYSKRGRYWRFLPTVLFTVTCRTRPLAVVHAESPKEAIMRARELVARRWRAELGVDLDVLPPMKPRQ